MRRSDHYRKHQADLPLVELWRTVAWIRLRDGDIEGARRARRNAGMASRQVPYKRLPVLADKVTTVVHFRAPEADEVACGYASLDAMISPDPNRTVCGNCRRSYVWRFYSCQDAAPAAGR